MEMITDIFGRKIRLTDERWEYIVNKRPILRNLRTECEITISEPELIKRSTYDPEVVLCYRYFKELMGGKYIVGVVRIDYDSFVVTGYITDRIKRGEVIWRKS